jgi:hypothetical protein
MSRVVVANSRFGAVGAKYTPKRSVWESIDLTRNSDTLPAYSYVLPYCVTRAWQLSSRRLGAIMKWVLGSHGMVEWCHRLDPDDAAYIERYPSTTPGTGPFAPSAASISIACA